MKKKLFSIVILATALPAGAQTVVANALVPQFIQGNAGTNNDRTPFWFWAELTGLTPGATYRFYTAMDSLNASASSNGAGNPYLINQTGNTIRRTTNPSFSNAANYDSLTAGNSGTASHWFGVEPTGNGRYTPGNTLFAKIMLNDGQGGTTVSERVLLALHPVTVIDYGTVPGDSAQGSGFYDSTGALANNFICIYDNPLAIGRPINIAIVENDGMDLYNLSVIVNFYANTVDTSAGRWGSIIPNNLPNGIRSIEERSFNGATPVDTVADMDGTWCSGVNTVNQGHGSSAVNLNSTFVLTGLANMPDSTWTGLPTTFSASSNDPNAMYAWDFGDLTTDSSGPVVIHSYTAPGIYYVTVVIYNNGCSITISQTVVVQLSTDILWIAPLYFGITPNPSCGQIMLSTRNGHDKTFGIYTVTGELIYSGTFNGNSFRLDISDNPPGVYFIRVKDEASSQTGIKKIVLQ